MSSACGERAFELSHVVNYGIFLARALERFPDLDLLLKEFANDPLNLALGRRVSNLVMKIVWHVGDNGNISLHHFHKDLSPVFSSILSLK